MPVDDHDHSSDKRVAAFAMIPPVVSESSTLCAATANMNHTPAITTDTTIHNRIATPVGSCEALPCSKRTHKYQRRNGGHDNQCADSRDNDDDSQHMSSSTWAQRTGASDDHFVPTPVSSGHGCIACGDWSSVIDCGLWIRPVDCSQQRAGLARFADIQSARGNRIYWSVVPKATSCYQVR